mmetsp:Transcript_19426/g.36124  ORF Transcript_19426/g.36124 Transcript_19426/m.36124 type:complete len:303 (+) Transcript_19426:61-969(+)
MSRSVSKSLNLKRRDDLCYGAASADDHENDASADQNAVQNFISIASLKVEEGRQDDCAHRPRQASRQRYHQTDVRHDHGNHKGGHNQGHLRLPGLALDFPRGRGARRAVIVVFEATIAVISLHYVLHRVVALGSNGQGYGVGSDYFLHGPELKPVRSHDRQCDSAIDQHYHHVRAVSFDQKRCYRAVVDRTEAVNAKNRETQIGHTNNSNCSNVHSRKGRLVVVFAVAVSARYDETRPFKGVQNRRERQSLLREVGLDEVGLILGWLHDSHDDQAAQAEKEQEGGDHRELFDLLQTLHVHKH